MGNVLKNFFVYGAGSIAQAALGFLLLPLYLRLFPPSEYGIISVLITVIPLVTIFASVGVVSGLYRLYYEAESRERRRLVGNACLWYFLTGALVGAVLFSQAPQLSSLLFRSGDYAYAIRLVGGFLFISLLQTIPFTILQLEKKAGPYVGFSLFRFLLDFALKLWFIAFLGRGIGGYFESGLVAYIIVLFSMFPFVSRYVSFSLNASYLRQLLRLGFPYVFTGIAMWSLALSDRLILNYFHGGAAVGIYSVAYSFAGLFSVFLSGPLALFIDPFFFSYAAGSPTEDIKKLLQKLMLYLFLAGGILYLAIALGTGDVLRAFTFLFGAKAEYQAAVKLVPLLTLSPFIYLLMIPAGMALLLAKKPEFNATAAIIAAFANLGLNFILIPKFGTLAAATSSVVAYILYAVLCYYWAQKAFVVDYTWGKLALGFLFLIVAFAIGWEITSQRSWLSLLMKVATGVVAFVLLGWFASGILTKVEKDAILQYILTIKVVKKIANLTKRFAGGKLETTLIRRSPVREKGRTFLAQSTIFLGRRILRLDKLASLEALQRFKSGFLNVPVIGSLAYLVYYLLLHAMIVQRRADSLWLIKVPGELKVFTPDLSDAVDHIGAIWRQGIYDNYRPQKGQVVLDAGAHIGIYTIKASKQVGRTGTVVAVEPHPGNFECLKKNIELNKCTNVVPMNVALASQSGRVELFIDARSAGHSIRIRSQESLAVSSTTVDQLVKECRLSALHLIKANVEGATTDLLKGAEETLRTYRPRIVTPVNHYSNEREEVADWLSNRGFVISVWHDILYAEPDNKLSS